MRYLQIGSLFTIVLAMYAIYAGSASAQCSQGTVKPGNSEVDQYQETIPGSCGDQKPGDGSEGGGGSLPADTVNELEALGGDGAAAAAIAAATAPIVERGVGSGGEPEPGSSKRSEPGSSRGNGLLKGEDTQSGEYSASDDGSSLSAVTRALAGDSSDGGLGLILPLILAGTPLAAAVAFMVRTRRSSA